MPPPSSLVISGPRANGRRTFSWRPVLFSWPRNCSWTLSEQGKPSVSRGWFGPKSWGGGRRLRKRWHLSPHPWAPGPSGVCLPAAAPACPLGAAWTLQAPAESSGGLGHGVHSGDTGHILGTLFFAQMCKSSLAQQLGSPSLRAPGRRWAGDPGHATERTGRGVPSTLVTSTLPGGGRGSRKGAGPARSTCLGGCPLRSGGHHVKDTHQVCKTFKGRRPQGGRHREVDLGSIKNE